jgi:hypothetical protein
MNQTIQQQLGLTVILTWNIVMDVIETLKTCNNYFLLK